MGSGLRVCTAYIGIHWVPEEEPVEVMQGYVGIVLNYCQYGVLYLGSYYNTGPYMNFPQFGNSNLGNLPRRVRNVWFAGFKA